MTTANQPKKQSRTFAILRWVFQHWRFLLILLLIGAIATGVWYVRQHLQNGEPILAVQHTEAIMTTPEEIRAIRDIKQWEFLAVETEELIEHHESHTFGDKHLVKVFRGTLRLGINMEHATDEWFRADSSACHFGGKPRAVLTLPDIELLDDKFIDEARTISFHESGTFSPKVKEQLYNEAAAAMKARTLSEQNLSAARQAAQDQFTRIFHALGFNEVDVTFVPATPVKRKKD